jgi:dTDP-4-amino-4,6-dideoxygalactose transaminase
MQESAALRAWIRHSSPAIGDQEIAAVTRVMRSGNLAQGREVVAFESECAALTGRRYGIAVSSGTAALHLSLAALEVKHLAIPAYACASLLTAARLHGARVSLCDVGPDFAIARNAIPAGCDAVIAVHLFGAPAQVPAHPTLVEDIAQSIGGPAGRRGVVSVASFYATKLMTTGEGGMVLTDDAGVAEFLRDRRDYDNRDTFEARYAYKMTDMQAAMGRVQLRRLPDFIARRRAIAREYNAAFRTLPLTLPNPRDHVFSRYVVDSDERAGLETHLHARGIEAKRPVYRPAHQYVAESDHQNWIVRRKQYPGADAAHQRALSLPVHPTMTDYEVEHVIDSVCRFFE